MPWKIQLDGKNLDAIGEIDLLTDAEIKRICFILDGDHFDRDEIKSLLEKGRKPRTRGATKSVLDSVCNKLEEALTNGIFEFDLFPIISGWFETGPTKPGGNLLEIIIKKLFYDQIFARFTELNNKQLVPDFSKIFLPWLREIFIHDHR
jgi:hypothetical protein